MKRSLELNKEIDDRIEALARERDIGYKAALEHALSPEGIREFLAEKRRKAADDVPLLASYLAATLRVAGRRDLAERVDAIAKEAKENT